MYKRHPVGDYHVGVCTNTLCAVMGGDAIMARLTAHLGIGNDEVAETALRKAGRDLEHRPGAGPAVTSAGSDRICAEIALDLAGRHASAVDHSEELGGRGMRFGARIQHDRRQVEEHVLQDLVQAAERDPGRADDQPQRRRD